MKLFGLEDFFNHKSCKIPQPDVEIYKRLIILNGRVEGD